MWHAMNSLQKETNRDFVILNITDTQITAEELQNKSNALTTVCGTTSALVEKVRPDLITVTGDLTYGGSVPVYEFYADFMDTFGIKWTFVWGNHDNQAGIAETRKAESVFASHPLCLFERGDEALGSGNYCIDITENGVPVETLIFIDSHDRVPYGDGTAYAKLIPEQLEWYRAQIAASTARGCKESTMFLHIPIYAFNDAYSAAMKDPEYKPYIAESYGKSIWNEGYTDSFGVKYEKICSHPEDDGVFDTVCELRHTKNIIAGHEHINNFSIPYRGVRLTYALKTGSGCYWNRELNGGTVIKVGSAGVSDIFHVYVDPCEYLN